MFVIIFYVKDGQKTKLTLQGIDKAKTVKVIHNDVEIKLIYTLIRTIVI